MTDNMIEVTLPEETDFLKARETLTRLGIATTKGDTPTLFQSCHILHKKGRYYITHFKELFQLDGKETEISDDDVARRNTIANLLAEWGIVKLVDAEKSADPTVPMSKIKVLSFKEKGNWNLIAKYSIGNKKE